MQISEKKINPAYINKDTEIISAALYAEETIYSSKKVVKNGDYIGREWGWFGKKMYSHKDMWSIFDGKIFAMNDKCTDESFVNLDCKWSYILKENKDGTKLIYKPHIEFVNINNERGAKFYDTLEEAAEMFVNICEKYCLD